jgi:hypothetical protein
MEDVEAGGTTEQGAFGYATEAKGGAKKNWILLLSVYTNRYTLQANTLLTPVDLGVPPGLQLELEEVIRGYGTRRNCRLRRQ